MIDRKRIGVLISGRGSNMEALIDASRAPDYPAEIALVISNRPDAGGLDTAHRNGIKSIAIDHRDFETRETFDAAVNNALKVQNIDIVACAGFMRIMTAGLIDAWSGRMINIHPSLLPSYRGLDTHERALADGVKIHGCTVHFVVPELDAGPIIMQAAVPVQLGDMPDTLATRVLSAEHQIYPRALAWVASGAVIIADGKVTGDLPGDKNQVLFSPALRAI